MDSTASFLKRTRQEFLIDDKTLLKDLAKSFRKSLEHDTSTFIPSSLPALPDHVREGEYLSLELGGSNLRCAIVSLNSRQATLDELRTWTIPAALKVGAAQDLFNWIAECLALVIHKHLAKRWSLAFVFSFPVHETTINAGDIQTMGKSYALTFTDRCLNILLKKALSKLALDVDLVVCMNDSHATLLAGMYNHKSDMALILGTGCNAALHMPLSGDHGNRRLVNCELSLLGRDVLPKHVYDRVINGYECNKGFQTLEYMTAGPWLGELARLMLLRAFSQEGFLVNGLPDSLEVSLGLQTDTLWQLEQTADVSQMVNLLNSLHPLSRKSWTEDDTRLLRELARLVSDRSARLVALCLMALKPLLARGTGETRVLCCGSIIESYPNYRQRCQAVLDELESGITLCIAEHSGLVGAAIAAACVTQCT